MRESTSTAILENSQTRYPGPPTVFFLFENIPCELQDVKPEISRKKKIFRRYGKIDRLILLFFTFSWQQTTIFSFLIKEEENNHDKISIWRPVPVRTLVQFSLFPSIVSDEVYRHKKRKPKNFGEKKERKEDHTAFSLFYYGRLAACLSELKKEALEKGYSPEVIEKAVIQCWKEIEKSKYTVKTVPGRFWKLVKLFSLSEKERIERLGKAYTHMKEKISEKYRKKGIDEEVIENTEGYCIVQAVKNLKKGEIPNISSTLYRNNLKAAAKKNIYEKIAINEYLSDNNGNNNNGEIHYIISCLEYTRFGERIEKILKEIEEKKMGVEDIQRLLMKEFTPEELMEIQNICHSARETYHSTHTSYYDIYDIYDIETGRLQPGWSEKIVPVLEENYSQ